MARHTRTSPLDLSVPDGSVSGPTVGGASPAMTPAPRQHARRVSLKAIAGQLRPAPAIRQDTLVDIIFDESASVRGGNDVIGLRHEVALVVVEHLVAVKSQGKWYLRVSTFDDYSVYDLAITVLDRQGLRLARDVLLRQCPGGSSVLGPSISRAEDAALRFVGSKRVLAVFSDYELYDFDPTAAMRNMIDSSADEVVAVSLNNEPPAQFIGSRVRTARVLASDTPADLANHVLDAVRACSLVPTGAP
jgi:hypothetical protein